MKEYIEIQKNIVAIIFLICMGIALSLVGIVLIFTYLIIGLIFTICIVVGVTLSFVILIVNCEISKVQISNNGIRIKEKVGLKFIPWEALTNCEITHQGRGVYKIVLMVSDKNYCIYNGIHVLDKLISYCSAPDFIKILEIRRDRA